MEVKDVANYLLNHCYIMGEVEETRDRYYYAINHLEELKKLFIQLGYTLAFHPAPLKIIMLVILPITAIFVLNKRALSKYRCPYTTRQTKTIITLLALFMGLYDGFYGPGTGTFLMLMLVGIAHISLEQAVGTTKVINLSTNLASLSVYLVHGKVLFPLALIAALFGIAGNYIGARHFTRKGAKFVKPIIITVLAIFFVKLCWELFIAKQ